MARPTCNGFCEYTYRHDSSVCFKCRFNVIFRGSKDTVLGESGDEKELFSTNQCEDIEILNFVRIVTVRGPLDFNDSAEQAEFHFKLR
jgi:hypothetical protein